MDNDPKSYRVPILHLKDVLKGNDEPEEGKDAPATDNPVPQKPAPNDAGAVQGITPSAPVAEEDIRSAVITPKGKGPIVLDTEEKKKVATEKPPEKKSTVTSPEKKQETQSAQLTTENIQINDVIEPQPTPSPTTPKTQKEDVLTQAKPTPPGSLTRDITTPPVFEKNEEEPVAQTPQKTTPLAVPEADADIPPAIEDKVTVSKEVPIPEARHAPEPSAPEIKIHTEDNSNQEEEAIAVPTEDEIKQEETFKSETKLKITPEESVQMKEVADTTPIPNDTPVETNADETTFSTSTEDEVDDLANLYSLVEKRQAEEAMKNMEREKEEDANKFLEHVETLKDTPLPHAPRQMPKIPTPDPLDIWEQDAARPRVPYKPKPKPVTPVANIPANKEAEPEKNEIVDEDIKQNIAPQPPENSSPKIPEPIVEKTEAIKKENTIPTVTGDSKENKQPPQDRKISIQNDVDTEEPKEKDTPKETLLQNNDTTEPIKKAEGLSNLEALRERAQREKATQNTEHEQKKESGDTHIPVTPSTQDKVHAQGDIANRPRPASKHAQALADIADRLHDMGNSETEAAKEPAILAQASVVEELPQEAVRDVAPTPKEPEMSRKVPGAIEADAPKPTFRAVESAIPMIRTFRQDVEQAVTRDRTSVVDMISAEEKRRSSGETIRIAPRQAESSWSYVFIGASMILVITAIAIGAFLFFRMMSAPNIDTEFERVTINETISYDITSQSRDQIMYGLVGLRDSLHTDLGSVTQIQLTERKNTGGDSAQKAFISTSLFLQKIESHAPGGLVRNLNDNMLLAVHELTKNEPFLMFTAAHYDIVFKNMFEWEDTMQSDLAPLFGPALELVETTSFSTETTTGTSSATSTPVRTTSFTPIHVFEDIVIANTPTRGVRNKRDEVVLVWSMPDDNTVIITSNETTMRTLLERIAARPY